MTFQDYQSWVFIIASKLIDSTLPKTSKLVIHHASGCPELISGSAYETVPAV